MNIYELVPYTDADHDNYIKCQMDAFEKYILEFFGVCDMAIMENHLKQLKPNLLKIAVNSQIAGYVYYKEKSTKIIVDVFTLLPEYRNNGLGSLILQDFIKKANELNKPIFLDTFKSNPAKNFYERNGFVVVDENFSHYILRYGKVIWYDKFQFIVEWLIRLTILSVIFFVQSDYFLQFGSLRDFAFRGGCCSTVLAKVNGKK